MRANKRPTDPDIDLKKPHIYHHGLRCCRCGAVLNNYNPRTYCFCHHEKEMDEEYGEGIILNEELTSQA